MLVAVRNDDSQIADAVTLGSTPNRMRHLPVAGCRCSQGWRSQSMTVDRCRSLNADRSRQLMLPGHDE